jgi:hypothetical protein
VLAFLALIACISPAPSDSGSLTFGDDDSTPTDDSATNDDTSTPPDDSDTPTDDSATIPSDFQVTSLDADVNETIGSIIDVSWTQNEPSTGYVAYRFEPSLPTDDWMQSPTKKLEGGRHEEILLGIPYGSTVTWKVVSDPDGADPEQSTPDQTIDNDPLPTGCPVPSVLVSDRKGMDPSIHYLLGTNNAGTSGLAANQFLAFIIDRDARVVWTLRPPSQRMFFQIKPSYDGDELLVDYNSFWAIYDNGDASQIARVKIDGSVIDITDTPGLHHGFTETADHAFLWPAYKNHPTDEWLLEKDAKGVQRTVFRCADWQESIGAKGENCGSNNVYWDEKTDSVYYSFFWSDTVVHLDRKSGEPINWFGRLPGAYAFDPPESQFWLQHDAHLNDDGTFMVSSHTTESAYENVARVYTIDDKNETLHLEETFGEGDGVYGVYIGEAWKLPNGNFLQNYGTNPRVREGQPDGTIVWDLQWDGNFMGRTLGLPDLYVFAP